MNYPSTYHAPTITTQQARTYYDDEGSSSSSASAYDRGGHRNHYDNRHMHMSTVPTIPQQQQLWRYNPSHSITSGRRSRSRTRRHSRSRTRRHSSEPRHHYDSRSRSSDELPANLPREYGPTSPDRHAYDRSSSRGFSHSFSPTHNMSMGTWLPGDPRTQPLTLVGNAYSTVPAQYTSLPTHSHHSHRHRSFSHSHPDGYFSSRPQHFHRRSRSHDDLLSGSPREGHPLPQQSHGGYSPYQPYQTQIAASEHRFASPMVIPQAYQTTVVPLNAGKDGWVVVPAQGQSQHGSSAHHARASGHGHRDQYSPSTGSFFSRFLNFGRSPQKGKFVVSQQPTMAQPVQYIIRPHKSRRRRDSY